MKNPITRKDLSTFLKSRRARLSPQEVGLPGATGRRVKGLRREEVVALAGVGIAWYTRLEQGREIAVSTTFLELLSNALRLDEAERIHLFALAQGRTPPISDKKKTVVDLEGVKAAVDAYQFPAYLRNSSFDVLYWNEANTTMFGDFNRVPASQRNVLQLMFSRPYYKENMPHWERDAIDLIAKFRLHMSLSFDKKAYEVVVADLQSRSSEFCSLWDRHDVRNLGEGVTHFKSRRHGLLIFKHQTLTPEGTDNLKVVLFVPDQVSLAKIRTG